MISGMARHELVGYALMGVGMVLCWGLLITDIVVLIRFATVDQRRQPTVRGLIKTARHRAGSADRELPPLDRTHPVASVRTFCQENDRNRALPAQPQRVRSFLSYWYRESKRPRDRTGRGSHWTRGLWYRPRRGHVRRPVSSELCVRVARGWLTGGLRVPSRRIACQRSRTP